MRTTADWIKDEDRDELPGATASLGAQVLVLTVSVWLLHFVFMISRSIPAGVLIDAGTIAARLIVAGGGVAICLAMYRALRARSFARPIDRFLSALLLGTPACALLAFVNEFAFSRLSDYYLTHAEMFPNLSEYVFTFSFFFWIFVAWSALYASLASALELRDQRRATADAGRVAALARLEALQLQLHPHFLFNTLNTLSGLVAMRQHEAAEQMILNLAAFLRYTLSTRADVPISLRQELDAQTHYLEIQRARYGDRLVLHYAIDEECGNALVPALLLQPLLENVAKHAFAAGEGIVTVTVSAHRDGEALVLGVRDRCEDAAGVARERGFGIGLANVRERLRVLFGERARFAAAATEHGWVSEARLPFAMGTR